MKFSLFVTMSMLGVMFGALAAVQPADLIVTGDIYTVDGPRTWAKALAVKGGKFVYVGTEKGVEPYRGKETKVIALSNGQMVLPGFHDSHVHLLEGGVSQQFTCKLAGAKTREEIIERLKAFAAEHPDQPWILGAGWDLPLYPDANPHKSELDAVFPDKPVWIYSSDGHSSWANSAALKIAGVDRNTPEPPRGRIERDPKTGEPTGTFREAAIELVDKVAPTPKDEQWEEALLNIQKTANSLGITSIQEALVSPRQLSIFHNVAKRDALTLKVVAALATDAGKPDSQVDDLIALRDKYSVGKLRATSAKIFEDGGIEGRTAALLEPYSDKPAESGILNWDLERLTSIGKRLDAAGFQLHIHSIGDRAARVALDAIEAIEKANGRNDNRHQIAHLEMIAPQDLPRFRELGVVANFQPFWCFSDSWIEQSTNPLIGPERASRLYQIKSVLDTGAVVAAGSDWTVSTLNPFQAIQVGMTRQPYEKPEAAPWLPDERVGLEPLIAAYTINGAYVNRQDKETGSIEVGKAADFIIIDRNLFAIPVHEIGATKVLQTYLDGKEVFRSENP